MREYKKKYQAELWSSDEKPDRKTLRKVEGSNRMKTKQKIKKLDPEDECTGDNYCTCYWCLFYIDGE